MAPHSCRGQVLSELLWTMVLVVSFASFLVRLHQATRHEHKKPRWELQEKSR